MSLYEQINEHVTILGDLCDGSLTCERAEKMAQVFCEYQTLLKQIGYNEIERESSFDFVATDDILDFEKLLSDQLSNLGGLCDINKGSMYEQAVRIVDAFTTVKNMLGQHPEYRRVNLDGGKTIPSASSDISSLEGCDKLKTNTLVMASAGKMAEEFGKRIYEQFIGSTQRYFSGLEERMSADDYEVLNSSRNVNVYDLPPHNLGSRPTITFQKQRNF